MSVPRSWLDAASGDEFLSSVLPSFEPLEQTRQAARSAWQGAKDAGSAVASSLPALPAIQAPTIPSLDDLLGIAGIAPPPSGAAGSAPVQSAPTPAAPPGGPSVQPTITLPSLDDLYEMVGLPKAQPQAAGGRSVGGSWAGAPPAASGTPAAMPTGGGEVAIDRSSPQAFLASFVPAASAALRAKGLPESLAPILAAIPMNEQGWQQPAPGNNYYGIKGSNPRTGANTGPVATWEDYGGGRTNIQDTFRAYASPTESVQDFIQFLEDNPRYGRALQVARETGSPEAFIREVHRAGYATDPAWSDKILNIAAQVPARPVGPQPTTPTAAEQTPAAQRQGLEGITPNQFALGDADAEAICGPVLAMAFAKANGRNPTIAEAKELARTNGGWTSSQGMGGPTGMVNTLKAMGIPATYAPGGLDIETIRRETMNGNPVGIDTPGHYFVIEGVDAQGRLNLGNSAKILRASGGRQWFAPEEIAGLGMGAPRGAIYKDSPASPTPSLAVAETRMPPAEIAAPVTTPGAPDEPARLPLPTVQPLAPWADAQPADEPLMMKETPEDTFLPGDGGTAPTTVEQPYNPDEGPREATPGSVGAQPLPQTPNPMSYGPIQQAEAPLGPEQPTGSSVGRRWGDPPMPAGPSLVPDFGNVGRNIGRAASGQPILPADEPSRGMQASARTVTEPIDAAIGTAALALERATGAPPGTVRQAAEDVSNFLGPTSAMVGVVRRGGGMADDAGRFARPTVEVLQEQLDAATSAWRRATDAGDTRMAAFARERAVELEGQLVDARNARLDLEPRITSDVGRRIETLPLDERSADDFSVIGRERARVNPDDLTPPSAVDVDMSGRMNATLMPISPEQIDAAVKRLATAFPQAAKWYAARAAENAAGMAAKGITPATKTEILRETVGTVGYGSMLGPGTASFNVAVGLMQPVWAAPKELVRAGFRAATTGNPAALREPAAAMGGAVVATGKVGQAVWDVIRARGAYAPNPDAPMLSQRLADPFGRAIMQALETPGRVWSGLPDAIFGTYTQHMVEARKAAQLATEAGHTGDKWREWVDLYLSEAERVRTTGSKQVSADVRQIIEAGESAAERAAMRRELGTIGEKAKKVAQMGGAPVIGNFLSPFFKGPWNAFLQQAERSPVGFAMDTQSTKFDKVYDALVGSAAIWGLYEMTTRGAAVVNGSGPTDKNARQAWLDEGNRPYSVQVGGVYIPNRMFGFAEQMLNAVGETSDAIKFKKPDADARALTEDALARVGKLIKQQPYANGYATIADTIQFGPSAAVADLATRLTPLSSTLRAAGTAGDDFERTVDRGAGVPMSTEIAQRWQQGTGQREGLPVAQDILGRPKENPQQGAAAFFSKLGYAKSDPIIGAFQANGVRIGDAPKEITDLGVAVPLTPAEQRRFDALRGEEIIRQMQPMVDSGGLERIQPQYRAEQLERIKRQAAEVARLRLKAEIGPGEWNGRLRSRLQGAAP